MNFDEIKDLMEQEEDSLIIPLSLSELKSSKDSIRSIKRNMLIESLFQALAILFFLTYPTIFVVLHDMAKGVYFYSLLIASAISILYVIHFLKFLRQKRKVSHDSKNALLTYFNDLKVVLAIYRTAMTASIISLLLPATILSIGVNSQSLDGFNSFIYMDYNLPNQIILFIIFVVLILFIYWSTNFWANWMYERHARRIELILEQYKI